MLGRSRAAGGCRTSSSARYPQARARRWAAGPARVLARRTLTLALDERTFTRGDTNESCRARRPVRLLVELARERRARLTGREPERRCALGGVEPRTSQRRGGSLDITCRGCRGRAGGQCGGRGYRGRTRGHRRRWHRGRTCSHCRRRIRDDLRQRERRDGVRLWIPTRARKAPGGVQLAIDERQREPGADPRSVARTVGPDRVPCAAVEDRDVVGARIAIGVLERPRGDQV